MKFEEYRQHDACGLAELVRNKEVTASELLDCALSRSSAVNPELNAIVIPMHEIARTRVAEELSGPFAGVPFLIKDIAQDHAGVASTAGSRAFRHYVPATHSEYVNRALAAGLVIFGKTNTPELALMDKYLVGGALVVAIFMLVARPLTVLVCCATDRRAKWTRNELLFMCWTRETGVIPAALVGMLAGMGAPGIDVIASVTFIAILMTILIQATTTPFVARKLGLLLEQEK